MSELVSIVMPVYNGAETVTEAVASVRVQSHLDWELLVVDDGSTDNTYSLLRKFNDPRIKVFRQENAGVSAARNRALASMQGDFFCFLDADDLLWEHSLKHRLEVFEDEEVSFVDGEVVIFDHSTGDELERRRQNFKGKPFEALIDMDPSCFFGPTWMIRRKPGEEYRFVEGLNYCEDLVFYLSIAEQGEYRAIESPVYGYRSGNVSAMNNLRALDRGYDQAADIISGWPNVETRHQRRFRRKAKSIMVKSYLKSGMYFEALKRVMRT